MAEYLTTDTKRTAPCPDMTEEDLQDFEEWAERINRQGIERLKLAGLIITATLIMLILLAI